MGMISPIDIHLVRIYQTHMFTRWIGLQYTQCRHPLFNIQSMRFVINVTHLTVISYILIYCVSINNNNYYYYKWLLIIIICVPTCIFTIVLCKKSFMLTCSKIPLYSYSKFSCNQWNWQLKSLRPTNQAAMGINWQPVRSSIHSKAQTSHNLGIVN